MPFAVVGSERNVVIDGKATPGRRTKWGIINIKDPSHCEFGAFRDFLLQSHLQELIEATALVHYETFRTKQLLALKESSAAPKAQNAQGAGPKSASPAHSMMKQVPGKK
jgi:septin 3/9/12